MAYYTFGLLAPTAMLLIGGTLIPSNKWLAGLSVAPGVVSRGYVNDRLWEEHT
ncbi:MAG: hypothetical protein ACXV3U_06425 [Halobacteriota archaeon]